MLNQVKDTSSLERGFKDTSSPCVVGGTSSGADGVTLPARGAGSFPAFGLIGTCPRRRVSPLPD